MTNELHYAAPLHWLWLTGAAPNIPFAAVVRTHETKAKDMLTNTGLLLGPVCCEFKPCCLQHITHKGRLCNNSRCCILQPVAEMPS